MENDTANRAGEGARTDLHISDAGGNFSALGNDGDGQVLGVDRQRAERRGCVYVWRVWVYEVHHTTLKLNKAGSNSATQSG